MGQFAVGENPLYAQQICDNQSGCVTTESTYEIMRMAYIGDEP